MYNQRKLQSIINDLPIPTSERLRRIQQDPKIVFGGDTCSNNIEMLTDGKGTQKSLQTGKDESGYARTLEIVVYFLEKDEQEKNVIERLLQYDLKYEYLIFVHHNEDTIEKRMTDPKVFYVNKNHKEIKAMVMSALEVKIINFLEEEILSNTTSSHKRGQHRAYSLKKVLQEWSLHYPQEKSESAIEKAKKLIDNYQRSDLEKTKIMDYTVTSPELGIMELRITVADLKTREILDKIYAKERYFGRPPCITISDKHLRELLHKEVLQGAELQFQDRECDEPRTGTLGGVAKRNGKMIGITCHHCLSKDGSVNLIIGGKACLLGKQAADINKLNLDGDVALIDVEERAVEIIENTFEKSLISDDLTYTPLPAILYRGNEKDDMYSHFVGQRKDVTKLGSVTGLSEGWISGAGCSSLEIKSFETFAKEGDSGSLIVIHNRDSENPVNITVEVLGVLTSMKKTKGGDIYFATPLFPFLKHLKKTFPDQDFDIEFYQPLQD